MPANAVWDSNLGLWRVGTVNDAGFQGLHRLYRESGTLVLELSYLDGKANGKFFKYHPNGELAREGEYQRGVPVGLEVAYASSAPTDEPLQKCCVPPGAVKLTLRHFDVGHFEEDFYDQHGRVLLPDGELQPERPPGVAPDARYKPHDRVWRSESYVRGKRHGTWRQWSAAGELVEVVDYEAHQVHGRRQLWREGAVCSEWHYNCGTRHGQGWEMVPPNTYVNTAIVRQAGVFDTGLPSGVWTYTDAYGKAVHQIDLGPPLVSVSERDTAVFTHDAESLTAFEGEHPSLRYFVALRRAARVGKEAVEAVLGDRPTWHAAGSERWLRSLADERLPNDKYIARLLEGLRRGADAPDVVCALARLWLNSPLVALALTELGLLLAPQHVRLLGVRVLSLLELGRVQGAKHAVEALRSLDAAAHAELELLLQMTFPKFGFWPQDVELDVEASEELPTFLAQDITVVSQTMAKLATRLDQVKHALSAYGDECLKCWPPGLAAGFNQVTAPLERYEFDVPADEQGDADHVVVDETLSLEGYTLSDLMNRARIDWVALCWLAFGVGLSEVRLPEVVLPQPDYGRALTTAFSRLYRVADQLKTRGYRARAQGLPDASWEGHAISSLPTRFLVQAQAEFMEMRAVLYFLGDESCKSLWQDDLRA